MMTERLMKLALPLVLLLGLSACSNGDEQEVRQWMAEVKSQTKVAIAPLAPPKKFTPFVYGAQNSPDPYSPAKLQIALDKARGGSGGQFKPNLDRPREALESYPLDTLTMVGTLEKPGLTYALLRADKSIFQAKVGNYVGQNIGRIVRITDVEVIIKETVQDASGEWVERDAKLELQETTK